MKAKDLMIGDWIHNNFTNDDFQVWPSFLAQATNYGRDLDRTLEDISCEPIPITAEILKENGFMPDDLCDYAEKYVCPVEIKKIPQTILGFTFYEGISADTLFKCWTKPESCDGENSVHICDLKYVHQLQHALRLCGVEKEIELKQ